jgi:protocatechuate 3,4-dioxygenase beta subunit
VISGRIVAADTGQPLRRARVNLHGNGMGREGARSAITDADGAFTIDALPAGRYSLSASKARYVPTMLGARRPGSPGRPIEVADGQRIESVTLALTNAGVITGHVTDDSGEPVIDVQVQAMRYRSVRGTRQLMPMSMSRPTDDTGAYRLHGLAPGTYYLMARDHGSSMRFGPEDAPSDESGFASTYYPGTPVASEAQPIQVVAGVDAVADLALVPTRLTTVSGIVVNAAGAPATGGQVSAMTEGMGFGGYRSGAMIKADGTFRLTGVAPGEYILQAHPTFEAPTPFGPRFSFGMNRRTASMPVVVAGTPLADLRLVVPDNMRIPVIATFEDATEKPPEMVGVSASSEKGRDGASAMRGEDGRLTLDVPPGTWRLSAHAASPWHVKRLTYRGHDVEPGDEVELTAEPGGRIEAVFTTKASVVTGGVKDGSGKPVSDYIAFILPAEGDIANRLGFGRLQVARPDQQGRFRAEGLRPGAYVAIAVEDLEMEEMFEPEVLEGLRKGGTPLRIRDGENPVLDLTLSSLP